MFHLFSICISVKQGMNIIFCEFRANGVGIYNIYGFTCTPTFSSLGVFWFCILKLEQGPVVFTLHKYILFISVQKYSKANLLAA